jgi:2',3'-cyclic-nucleotide 2'-phosphodiesterase (5'-nucleotidase family)
MVTTQAYYDRYDLAPWGASVIRDYLGIDVGFVNAGGFRVTMESGTLTMGELVTIYPFDNVIKTSQLTGYQLNDFCDTIESNDIIPDQDAYCYGGTFYIDGSPVNGSTLYTVGAVDYIFDKTYYMFLQGQNITSNSLLYA